MSQTFLYKTLTDGMSLCDKGGKNLRIDLQGAKPPSFCFGETGIAICLRRFNGRDKVKDNDLTLYLC